MSYASSACRRPQMHDVQSFISVEAAPASEPITLSEAKLHCRREDDFTAEDTLFTDLIRSARETVESDTERAFIEQTLTLTLDQFPDVIELRRCPIFDPDDVEITYTGATLTVDPSDYRVDGKSEPGRIAPAFGTSWPATRCELGSVSIQFTAGYSDSSLIPGMAKQAMKLLIGHWYRNRESVIVGTIQAEIDLAYNSLTERLRWGGYR